MIENMIITVFPDVKAKDRQEHEVSWNQIVNRITNPKVFYKKTSMPLLKLAKFGDIKTDQGSYRHDSNVLEVYGIEGDYDGEKISIEEAASRLKKHGVAAALYSSPSSTADKPRWRVLAPFSHGREPEERYHLCGMLNAALGGILARESFTLSQTYYFGSASLEYVAVNIEGDPIDTKEGQWDAVFPQKSVVTGTGQVVPRQDRIADCIKEIYSNASYYEPALRLTAMYFNSGMSRKDAISTVKAIMEAHPSPNGDINEYIAHVDGFLAGSTFVRPEMEIQTSVEALTIEWQVDAKGKIEPNQGNLIKLLEAYQLRYDNFRAAYMGCFDGVVRTLKDTDFTRIQYDAEKLGFKRVPTAMVRENALHQAESNVFDSAIEWGKSLKWDGISRCESLLPGYFGSDDNEYTRSASLYIASAMGGRLMEPGCKADAAIVLVGSQGVGKTVAIQALAPMEETFVEINLATRDSDQSRQLRGKLIGELGELRGLRSREAEDIKSWMSRTAEEWIPKYKEFSESFKRRLTFWGSTNEQQFLNDVTGNRRWIPIKVTKPDAEKIKQDRDQIWAEAIHIFNKNGIIWEQVQSLLDDVHQEFFDEDPLVESVREILERQNNVDRFRSAELWKLAMPGYDFDRKAQHRLKLVMVLLKWVYGKHDFDGIKYRGYKRP